MQRLGRYGWHTASPNPRRHHVLDREDLESTHGVVVSSDLGCQGVLPWLFLTHLGQGFTGSEFLRLGELVAVNPGCPGCPRRGCIGQGPLGRGEKIKICRSISHRPFVCRHESTGGGWLTGERNLIMQGAARLRDAIRYQNCI